MLNFDNIETNLDSNYEIIKYEKKYYNSVKTLFYESYRRKKPETFFKYSLSKTPYGNAIVFLMKHKNEIVGLHAIKPFLLNIKNHKVLGGLTFNTMTHPLHRNKRIFSLLSKKTHEEAMKRKFEFVLGFASSYSIKGYETKLNHKELKPINYIKIKNIKFDVANIPKIRNNWFPKNLGKLNDKYLERKKFPIRIERDDKFLIWRYKNNPDSNYFTCFSPDEYFFIFKKYQNSLHIIDFFGRGSELYKILFSTAKATAKKLGCKEVSMWIPLKHPIMQMLDEKCITQLKAKQFFHVLAINKKLNPILLDLRKWYYTMGDSDVF